MSTIIRRDTTTKQNEYHVALSGQISIAGTFTAPSVDVAIETATMEMRLAGEITDLVIHQAIYIDPEPDAGSIAVPLLGFPDMEGTL
jgi:hypothetical protein